MYAVASATAADTARWGCLPAKGTAEPAEHGPTVAERAHATVEAVHALLTNDIAAWQRNGDLASDADPGKWPH
ncbi:hypothetical protein [Streptacidiphilus griseoplanus]|uniref:hypothetical protein n=1 Tax=Peterkaempfera griseoplana TaxID=66896 RepID=UPI001FDFF0EF|nr:hypothetical protein [Peterkaempfera griseoplana]